MRAGDQAVQWLSWISDFQHVHEAIETMVRADRPREAAAQAALPQRAREYGQAFVEIARAARR